MSITLILRLLGGCLLLATNAFFVSIEFSLTRLRQYNSNEFKDDPKLKRAWEMTKKLEIYLTGCQVGITFSSVLIGITVEPAIAQLIQPLLHFLGVGTTINYSISIVLSLVFINLAHTVWAEQTPTYLGIEKAKTVARYCATPHYYWTKFMYPFIFVGDWLTKATLKLFGVTMSRSWRQGEDDQPARGSLKDQMTKLMKGKNLSEDRQDEIIKAVEIDDITVHQIMIPRSKINYLSTANSFDKNLNIVRETMKNRYPLISADLDDFVGILYTPEILGHITQLQNSEMTLDDLDHYHLSVPPKLNISNLIDRFQSNRQELALVIENDNVIGLVTLTDALEVIVGSAEDPTD